MGGDNRRGFPAYLASSRLRGTEPIELLPQLTSVVGKASVGGLNSQLGHFCTSLSLRDFICETGIISFEKQDSR